MSLSTDIFWMLFLAGVLVATAINDVRVQKIPNGLTYPVMAVALVYHAITRGLDGFVFSLEGLALGTGVLILPYIFGGTGAGDAKLMGAVGACLGPRGALSSFILSSVAGGVYGLIMLVTHHSYGKGFIKRSGLTLKTLALTGQFILVPASEGEKKPKLCYGVAIAAGTMFYMFLELSGKKFFL